MLNSATRGACEGQVTWRQARLMLEMPPSTPTPLCEELPVPRKRWWLQVEVQSCLQAGPRHLRTVPQQGPDEGEAVRVPAERGRG